AQGYREDDRVEQHLEFPSPVPRYRFDEFLLSPRRRVLLRNGVEQPLIPRYFDLLRYLIERRGDAVHRRDIFDAVWSDVVVSDSALSQAIRTIRRVLDDDPREPRFVKHRFTSRVRVRLRRSP
ncbi:MAG: winged helix-turn-helix domain-containing protein, partial [Vicinamibacterales bacterium]